MRRDRGGSATPGADASAAHGPTTFDAASWSLLLGVVAFTAACSGDDDSAGAPTDSAVIESTALIEDATEATDAPTDTADEIGAGTSEAAEQAAGDDTTVTVTTEIAARPTTVAATVVSSTLPSTTDRPDDTASTGGDGGSVSWTDPTNLFSLSFPGEPTATEIPVPDAGNGATLTAYVYETTESAFLANRTDATELDESATGFSLEAAVDGSLSFLGGTVGSQQDTTIQGRDGIRFEFTVAGGVGEGLTVGDGVVIYQILAIGESSSQPELAAFVDSFSFTEGQ